jgi:uncharacterized protein YdeI (YjbR/CyaY-like superfamily)
MACIPSTARGHEHAARVAQNLFEVHCSPATIGPVMTNQPKPKLFPTREKWRAWLAKNHATSTGVWLSYYKKHVDKKSIAQAEAVEEALCFGWIDSTVRRVDDERYMQRFTPRKDSSVWSALNKWRVSQLKKKGLMTEAGLERVRVAKRNGQWNAIPVKAAASRPPRRLTNALANNKRAKEFFDSLTTSQKYQYVAWIEMAKKDDTKVRRVTEVVKRCAARKKPGIV